MSVKNYSKWMENLPKELNTLSIGNLSIPGSHDSFSYSITPTSDLSPDAESITFQLVKLFGSCAKTIVYNWAVTQDLNTFQQLINGIRYFDIRVAVNNNDNTIYCCHSLYGQPIKTELELINNFLQLNTKEVVLLDFNHYYNFTRNQHIQLLQTIEEIFGELLVEQSNCLPSLSDLWKINQRVFIFYRFEENYKKFIWPSLFISSPWANTDEVNYLIKFLDQNYKDHHHQINRFYVTQGVLTPTCNTIFQHLCGSLRNTLARVVIPQFLSWLSKTSCGPNNTNCVIIDFFNDSDFVDKVINLNMKYLESPK